MTLAPGDALNLVNAGGIAGVLLLIVIAFLRGWVMTAGAAERLLSTLTEGKDKQIAELTRQRDQFWDLAQRNAGSQLVQANVMREVQDAIFAALKQQPSRGTP